MQFGWIIYVLHEYTELLLTYVVLWCGSGNCIVYCIICNGYVNAYLAKV